MYDKIVIAQRALRRREPPSTICHSVVMWI